MENLEMIINNIAEECSSKAINVKCFNKAGLIGVTIEDTVTVEIIKHECDGEVVYGINNKRPQETTLPEHINEIISRNIVELMM